MSHKRRHSSSDLDSPPPIKPQISSDYQSPMIPTTSSKKSKKRKIMESADNEDHRVVSKIMKVKPQFSRSSQLRNLGQNEEPNPSKRIKREKREKREKSVSLSSQSVQNTLTIPPSTTTAKESSDKKKKAKKKAHGKKDDFKISIRERNDLVGDITREEAQRMVENMDVPKDREFSDEQLDLFIKLSERGARPLLSGFWARDFPTLPERLFTLVSSEGDSAADSELMFKAQERSEFYAIKALQDVFALSGRVRDSRKMHIGPATVVAKTITKYMRWATENAGLKAAKKPVLPVHHISLPRKDEDIGDHIIRATKELEDLAIQHQKAHGGQSPYWPTILGFVLAEHILCLLTIETDPSSEVWSSESTTTFDGGEGIDNEFAGINNRSRFLTNVDLSTVDNDVWNSLTVAIGVNHVKDTMVRMATILSGNPLVPRFKGQRANSDDEDL